MNKPEYKDVCDFENLYQAAVETIQDKKLYPEELHFGNNLEEELIKIQNDLIWHTYKPGEYCYFYVYDPKERLICAPFLRDRVVQSALCRVLEQYIEPRFDFDSYACRKGKGTLAAANRAASFAKKYTYYAYFDIKGFFDNIPVLPLEQVYMKRFVDDPEIKTDLVCLQSSGWVELISHNGAFYRSANAPKTLYTLDAVTFYADVERLNSVDWSGIKNPDGTPGTVSNTGNTQYNSRGEEMKIYTGSWTSGNAAAYINKTDSLVKQSDATAKKGLSLSNTLSVGNDPSGGAANVTTGMSDNSWGYLGTGIPSEDPSSAGCVTVSNRRSNHLWGGEFKLFM